jgi:predicted CopG family antitoxin
VTETTNIEVSREHWQALNRLKEGPGESFDDVVGRLLDEHSAVEL